MNMLLRVVYEDHIDTLVFLVAVCHNVTTLFLDDTTNTQV